MEKEKENSFSQHALLCVLCEPARFQLQEAARAKQSGLKWIDSGPSFPNFLYETYVQYELHEGKKE